jgi:hypothetical protein
MKLIKNQANHPVFCYVLHGSEVLQKK